VTDRRYGCACTTERRLEGIRFCDRPSRRLLPNQSIRKIGLIGANGAGKTTLLKIIGRAHEIDTGTVTRKSGLQIGTLDQIPDFHEGTSSSKKACAPPIICVRPNGNARTGARHRIRTSAGRIDRYSRLQHEFELKGGYSYRALTESALLGVGFSKEAMDRPSRELSGGEKIGWRWPNCSSRTQSCCSLTSRRTISIFAPSNGSKSFEGNR